MVMFKRCLLIRKCEVADSDSDSSNWEAIDNGRPSNDEIQASAVKEESSIQQQSRDTKDALPVRKVKDNDGKWSENNLQNEIDLFQLNEKEAQQLRLLKEKMKGIVHYWNDPHVALGFMKGPAGYDAEQTEAAMRKLIQWRLDNKIDHLLEEYKPNPLMLDYIPMAFLNDCDYDGDPILVDRGGASDILGLSKRFSKEEIEKHTIWLRECQTNGEFAKEYERRHGQKMKQITLIYDLEGLSVYHMYPQMLNWFTKILEITHDYYPGVVKRVIIIRAPTVFRAVWKTVQSFFSEYFRGLMIFAERNKHLEVLGKYMDVNVLPPCINPDGNGKTAVGMPKRIEGGSIPYYVGNEGKGYERKDSVVTEDYTVAESYSTTSSQEVEDQDGPREENDKEEGQQISGTDGYAIEELILEGTRL